jgi:predicted nucleic acid-binding protein
MYKGLMFFELSTTRPLGSENLEMNGNNVVLDSDVIILASKQMIDVEKLLAAYEKQYVSIVSYIEVYGFDFPNKHEKELVDRIFQNLELIDLGPEIANIAIKFRSDDIKKIKLPDAAILATAKHLEADLRTNNLQDFIGVDPSVPLAGIDDLRL